MRTRHSQRLGYEKYMFKIEET